MEHDRPSRDGSLDDLIEMVASAQRALEAALIALENFDQLPLNLEPSRSRLDDARHLVATEHESLVVAAQVISRDLPLGLLPESQPDPMFPPDAPRPSAPSTRQLGYMARLGASGVSVGTYRDLIARTGHAVPDPGSSAWPRKRLALPVDDDARYEYELALARAKNPLDCGAAAWIAAISEQPCPRCDASPGAPCRTNTGNFIALQDSHAGRKKPAQRALGWTDR